MTQWTEGVCGDGAAILNVGALLHAIMMAAQRDDPSAIRDIIQFLDGSTAINASEPDASSNIRCSDAACAAGCQMLPRQRRNPVTHELDKQGDDTHG